MNTEDDEISREVAAVLFEKYSLMMYKAAFKETRNREDAMDAIQNVFTRLMENWPSSSFMKDPKAYLYRAARNEARNFVNSQRQRNQREVDVDSMEIAAAQPHSRPGDRRGYVSAALAKMKPRLFEVLNLFYNEGYDCSEIAAMQGRLSATVFSDLCRARTKLKQLIAIEENGQ